MASATLKAIVLVEIPIARVETINAVTPSLRTNSLRAYLTSLSIARQCKCKAAATAAKRTVEQPPSLLSTRARRPTVADVLD
jgi:hypothetical protein